MTNLETFDFSYSGIVEIVQSNKEIGIKLITDFAQGVKTKELEIEEAEKKLKELNYDKTTYRGGIEKICKHLQIHPPLNLLIENKIYAINDKFEVAVFEVHNM